MSTTTSKQINETIVHYGLSDKENIFLVTKLTFGKMEGKWYFVLLILLLIC